MVAISVVVGGRARPGVAARSASNSAGVAAGRRVRPGNSAGRRGVAVRSNGSDVSVASEPAWGLDLRQKVDDSLQGFDGLGEAGSLVSLLECFWQRFQPDLIFTLQLLCAGAESDQT